MTDEMRFSPMTHQEQRAVTACLKATGGPWDASPPDYATFSRAELSKKLEQVRDAVLAETCAAKTDVESAYERSQRFVDSAFDFYEGKKDLGRRIGRAFVVPVRSTRSDPADLGQGSGYASESTPFYPLLDPVRFGVSSEIRMRTIYGLPPTILDTYLKSHNDNEAGALVLAPVYADMVSDIMPDPHNAEQSLRLAEIVDRILVQTVEFAHKALGAKLVGLGATLPLLTNFGDKLRRAEGMHDLTTTTGHGGTVYMLAKTVVEAMARSRVDSGGTIGVVGAAGSIGWSSVQAIKNMLPDHEIEVFDKRTDRLRTLVAAHPELGTLKPRESAAEVFKNNRYVVCAITGKLDLSAPEFDSVDFSHTRVIDDSQPGAIDRAQMESLGGQVFWVAGRDRSPSSFMTRDGYHTDGVPYNYGDDSGLYGQSTEFACGLEAATIAAGGDRSKAITQRVEYRHVQTVGALFEEYGVEVADFQAFGKPVDIR
ncbi:hypothetical protein A5672_09820 [Mycobacterium alsense]|uniref:Uncharacterized protein n=1 Tax=Mycobacterium alsense TaxID=324058 RepID=A0ABD6P7A2_9MYCO|nr:hypothetical protein [Mycobacterium alsense]OBG44283.1 hypothetical protein A5672_09820 [Mycobacterium alsense]